MRRYIVGWAFAFATEAYIAELKVAHADHLCWTSSDGGTPSCHVFDVAVASSFTLIGGLVLLLVKPWAAEVECGSGVAVDFAEDLLEDYFAMLVRALSVVVMVLWYDAAHDLVLWNSEATESGKTTVTKKLLVFWAFAITYVGSIVSAALEQWEGDLKKKGGRLLFVDCVCSYSDLLQDSLAFVAGCAWSDVVCAIFTSLNSVTPTPSVLLANTAISVLVAAIALVWFVVTGNNTSSPSASAASRSHVEKCVPTSARTIWRPSPRSQHAISPRSGQTTSPMPSPSSLGGVRPQTPRPLLSPSPPPISSQALPGRVYAQFGM